MKKIIVLFICLLALQVQPASAFLTDWKIDLNGLGGAGTILNVHSLINTQGYNFIDTPFTGPAPVGTPYSFTNSGVFQATGSDAPSNMPSNLELTGVFKASGNGVIGGNVTFLSGTLDVYVDSPGDYGTSNGFFGANNGTPIGSFSLVTGNGSVGNNGFPNGEISVVFSSTSLVTGYWLDSSGNDLAGTTPISYVLGLSTTNASFLSNPVAALIKSELLQLAGYAGNPANVPPSDFFLGSNGQYRLNVVPEPATILLLGGGLVCLGFMRRKYRK